MDAAERISPEEGFEQRDLLSGRDIVLGERNGIVAWGEYFAMRGAVSSLASLPYTLRGRMIRAMAALATRVMPERVGYAREFLSQAFGEDLEPARRDELVQLAFEHLCHVVVEDVARKKKIPAGKLLDHIQLEGDPEALAQFRKGGPAVIINLHLGDWEVSAQALAKLGFGPLYVVGKPTKNKPVSAWIQNQREKDGVFMIARNGAIELAQKAVSGGGSLGLMLDHRATSRPVVTPFFGRLALSERSAGILVKRLRIPAFVVACLRTERAYQYRFVVQRVITPEESRRLRPEELTNLLNGCFEEMIRQTPEQYFWLHDRYRGVEKALRRAAKGKSRRVKLKKVKKDKGQEPPSS